MQKKITENVNRGEKRKERETWNRWLSKPLLRHVQRRCWLEGLSSQRKVVGSSRSNDHPRKEDKIKPKKAFPPSPLVLGKGFEYPGTPILFLWNSLLRLPVQGQPDVDVLSEASCETKERERQCLCLADGGSIAGENRNAASCHACFTFYFFQGRDCI